MTVDVSQVLIPEHEIKQMVARVASEINKDYQGEDVLIVGVLTGSFVFLSDLIRELDMDVEVDFIQVSSYSGTTSTGVLSVKKDLSTDISGRNVIIVEDIIDTGYTLKCLKEMLLTRKPKSLKICSAFDKRERRTCVMEADYQGIVVPDEFIVGYGLDYNGYYRDLKDVCIAKLKA